MAFNTKVTNHYDLQLKWFWFRTVVIWLSCMIYGDCRKHDILCVRYMLTQHFTTHNLCFKSKTFVPSCAKCSRMWKCHPKFNLLYTRKNPYKILPWVGRMNWIQGLRSWPLVVMIYVRKTLVGPVAEKKRTLD